MNAVNIRLLIAKILIIVAFMVPIAQPTSEDWYVFMWFSMVVSAILIPNKVAKEDFMEKNS